jgi:hypothetical protein
MIETPEVKLIKIMSSFSRFMQWKIFGIYWTRAGLDARREGTLCVEREVLSSSLWTEQLSCPS